MRIIKEALVGDYRFVLSPDYFCVMNQDREELVHINIEEITEITSWLDGELFNVSRAWPKPKTTEKSGETKELAVVAYDPGPRSFERTEALPMPARQGGNAGLAKQGPDMVSL